MHLIPTATDAIFKISYFLYECCRSRAGHKTVISLLVIVVIVAGYSLLVTVTLVLKSMSYNLVLYIYFQSNACKSCSLPLVTVTSNQYFCFRSIVTSNEQNICDISPNILKKVTFLSANMRPLGTVLQPNFKIFHLILHCCAASECVCSTARSAAPRGFCSTAAFAVF